MLNQIQVIIQRWNENLPTSFVQIRPMNRLRRLIAHLAPASPSTATIKAVGTVQSHATNATPIAAAAAAAATLPSVRYGVRWQNWARVQSCVPAAYFTPTNTDQLRAVLLSAHQNKQTVKVRRPFSCD